ncbi:MAG TPA: polysaccharide deacetylase [Clostridium sp.]|mgnify:CR=1 FL=1|jgi:peptidoglycan/xylan/chitin deacetylase (PgdA/CDA1 family)|uniref:Polysaccharide deacetylase family protein n=1 Tax=Clostridium lapidicellarium TaxID=3240931 RepID=A0ABV4DYM6_9CLOT|nr:polysaccharide deacetylase family protein [uncultured Clostridium sp.]NLU08203.1 polysaccharide deacetylase [Clostridiales bacterium]HBC98036.1 polysaccharide deacetylase [Clostridium sp.]
MKYKKNALIISISILFLFSLGFIYGAELSHKKSKTISANNSSVESQKYMNKRESNVQNISLKDQNNFNPYRSDGRKVVYLTFDDGPSANNTPQILKILKKYNVKATFFLIGKNAERNKSLVKEEAAGGNIIGNHTYSHDMRYIYSNPKIFISDVKRCDGILKSILGNNYNLKLIRFPGGSFGQKLQPFREEAKKNGYQYVDWNDLTGDAEHNGVPVEHLINKVKRYSNHDHLVVLMHDAPTKVTTVQALPQVIEYFKSQGYSFETLK